MSHTLAAGNTRATGMARFDGGGATPWERMMAENPQPDAAMVERIQRGEI